MKKFQKSQDGKLIEVGNFYGPSTEYLKNLPNSRTYIEKYKQEIRDTAENKRVYCFMVDKNEFENTNIELIKHEVNKKFQTVIYLAEYMGYEVTDRSAGVFCDGDTIGFMLDITEKEKELEKNRYSSNNKNVIQFNELPKQLLNRQKNRENNYRGM